MKGLNLLQPPEEFVEFGIGDKGCVLLVIRESILPDEVDEVFVFLADRRSGDGFRFAGGSGPGGGLF
jgi:hypothetical protein